jgi:hypothetical protein
MKLGTGDPTSAASAGERCGRQIMTKSDESGAGR